MAWHVYIIECSDGSLYTGITNDLDKSITAHNDGRGAKYTKSRRPVRLRYSEPAADRDARRDVADSQAGDAFGAAPSIAATGKMLRRHSGPEVTTATGVL